MIDHVAIYNSLVAQNPFPLHNRADEILASCCDCLWAKNMPQTKAWMESCMRICRERWAEREAVDILVAKDYVGDHSVLQRYMDFIEEYLEGKVYITDKISQTIFFLVENKTNVQTIFKLDKFENHMAELYRSLKDDPETIADIYERCGELGQYIKNKR